MKIKKDFPLVSVIIPTRNSGNTLKTVLEAIKSQTYAYIQLIVVDNKSKDDTLEIASQYTDNIHNYGNERSEQKNYGAKIAMGELLFFLDSDAEPTPDVIQDCVNTLTKYNADMVIIPEFHSGKGFWAKVKTFERKIYLGNDSVEAPWFFKKEAFMKVGGYNETLIAGEDWHLFDCLKDMGYTYCRSTKFIRHHLGHLRFFSNLKKKFYYGRFLKHYISINKGKSIKRIPFFRLGIFKKWKLLIRHPILTVSMFLMKFFESTAVFLGMILSNLSKGDVYEKK